MKSLLSNRHTELIEKRIGALPKIFIAENLQGKIATMLASHLANQTKLLLVADAHTWQAVGARVAAELAEVFNLEHFIYAEPPLASLQEAEKLAGMAAQAQADFIFIVGSGSLNDISQYAAHLCARPYGIFATAPSMNGYASATASLEVHGHKTSFCAPLPAIIFVDGEVMARAPQRLIQAGLGDALARSTAQSDWLLSHLLLDTPYDTLPFEICQKHEHHMLADVARLARRELPTMLALSEWLLLSGLGMSYIGTSAPASQGEHMLVHALHMRRDASQVAHYHGEEVGVATLYMAALQEHMLECLPQLASLEFPKQEMQTLFGEQTAASMHALYQKKKAWIPSQPAMQARLQQKWPDIAGEIRRVQLPEHHIRHALSSIGAATNPIDLLWRGDCLDGARQLARFTRDRFTFLDLYASIH